MVKKSVVIRCFALAIIMMGYVLIEAELSWAKMLSERIGLDQTKILSSSRTHFYHRVLDTKGGHAQIGDINNDGRNDIVVHHQEYLAWFSYPDYQKQIIQEGHFSGDRYALSDLDQDGDLDVISGTGRDETNYQICWYENDRTDKQSAIQWKKHVLGVQGQYIKDLMAADIDQDSQMDVIARSHGYTHIFFQQSDSWQPRRINHPFKEGMALADLDRDGDTDIILNGFWLETPANPRSGEFKQHTIADKWFTQKSGSWQDNCASVAVGDVNGDGLLDVLLSHSEKVGWPVVWYSVESPVQTKTGPWCEHVIAGVFDWCETLQVGDIDRDGHLDVMAAKFERDHKNPKYMNEPPFPILVFYNLKGDGSHWTSQQVADTGVYAGVLGDVGSDGDLDIVGPRSYWIGPCEFWENNLSNPVNHPWIHHNPALEMATWKHLSNQEGDFPKADVGRQAATLVFDIDKNGVDDFVIAGWNQKTSMVWFRYTQNGWQRYLIDNRKSHIEAGGDFFDIDGDGDLDILHGGSWAVNQVWWWENPYPNYDPNRPWNRYTIKDWGQKQHHDQIFGDFDGDGKVELVFWNQRAQKLFVGDIPVNPKHKEDWKWHIIWSWPKAFKYEGFAKADVDLDGKIDLIGGGRWFKHVEGFTFEENVIDPNYGMSRSAVADFIQGGRSEIILNSGDGIGPLNLYEWQDDHWFKTTLIEKIDHGHTLQTADFNGDGHPDIYAAEMYNPGPKAACRQYLLYGDGQGHFEIQVLSTGIGTHEGKVGDLDGDGDIDILQKDFQHEQRVDVWINQGTDLPVKLIEDAVDESAGNLVCFKIVTPSATYYLEKSGGGLSSMIDRDGIDWIGFHPEQGSGAAGEYRGFPNAVHQQSGNYFHPRNRGTDPCTSRIIKAGPQHVAISVVSSNELWAGRYDFYPTHCTFTMTRMPADKLYWILYEGVPGGKYDDADWWMTSAVKQRTPLTNPHDSDILAPEWIVFGDARGLERVLFLYHHEDDIDPDRFYQMQQKMTVFGFGRKGLTKYLDYVPQSFSIGFLETTDHPEIERYLKDLLNRAKSSLDRWQYIQVDEARDKRGFGLAFGDINHDGYQDIMAGKWFYRNPGGDMTGVWQRVDIDDPIDVLAVVDIDGDEFGDVIGLRPNEQYWYEAEDELGIRWRRIQIGSLPIDDHRLSTQIYGVGQIIPGGKPEILLANYFLEIPARPQEGNWPAVRYSSEGHGYAIGDIDRDGLLDIGGSYRVEGKGLVPGTRNVTWDCSRTCWWKNPGNGRGNWQRFGIGTATHADRYALVDLNGDGRLDLVITEERYPGHVANGSCYWFEQPTHPTTPWSRHLVVTQLSMNNLDAGDVDRDGDIDLVTCEHTMPYQGKPAPDGIKLEIWENNGQGQFISHVIDREKESHLGAQLVDLDSDGDLDIVSIAWRDYQYLHIWRNDR